MKNLIIRIVGVCTIVIISIVALSCPGPIDLYQEVEEAVDKAKTKNYLNLTTLGGGEVYPSGTIEIGLGESKTIEATASEECYFVEWVVLSGKATIEDSKKKETAVTLQDKQAEIRALFSSSLTVNSSVGGSSNPSGEVADVIIGEPFEIKALPDAGYYFAGWKTTNGILELQDSGAQSTYITLVNGPATVESEFTTITYQLTLSSDGHGSVSPLSPVSVAPGATQSISAEPNVGYDFENWHIVSGIATIGDKYSKDTTVILEDRDVEIEALFNKKNYTLTMISNDATQGTVSPNGDVSVLHGEQFSINAEPEAGYDFLEWEITDNVSMAMGSNTSDSSAQVILCGDGEVRAYFKPEVYSLSFSDRHYCTPEPGPDEVISIEHGDSYSVNVVATNSGRHFDHWEKVDGEGLVEFENEETPNTTVTVKYGDVTIRPIGLEGVKLLVYYVDNQYGFQKAEEHVLTKDYILQPDYGDVAISTLGSYQSPLFYGTYVFDKWELDPFMVNTDYYGKLEDPEAKDTIVTVIRGDSTLGFLRVEAQYKEEYPYTFP